VAARSRSSTLVDEPTKTSNARIAYGLTTACLVALMAAVVVDGVTPAAIFGVDAAVVRDRGDGIELEVTYGEVSRPALATPFAIDVTRPGGFDGPVRLAVDQSYLQLWDENGLFPAPAAETVMGPWLVWEFDPPIGERLRVTFDARIEPAAQSGRDGAVAVLDADDQVIVDVRLTTRVWP
jgi:hypothetical protein